MKKSLLAVAVAAALPAFAQAQTAITLYGIADAAVSFKDFGKDATGTKRSAATVDSGAQSTSRIGIRGTEDLGGGLSAVFNYEAGITGDTGLGGSVTGGTGTPAAGTTTTVATATGGLAFTRRSVVGLSGGFGTILLGRDYLPGFISAGATDALGSSNYNSWLLFPVTGNGANGIGGGGLVGPARQSNTIRGSNGIHYVSPSLGGLTIRAMYALGESDVEPKRVNDILGISGVFAAGPITAQAYYHTLKVLTTGTSTDNDKQYGLGAGYNFGRGRVMFNYGVGDPAGADTAAIGKTKAFQISGGINAGPGEVLLSVIRLQQDTDATIDKRKATAYGVTYNVPMSKRTNIYATFGTTRNNSTGNFVLRAGDFNVSPANTGESPKALSLGVRHNF